MNGRLIPHLAWLAGLLILVQLNAAAANPASPGVEVKLFFDPSLTLDPRNQPGRDVLAAFEVIGNPVTISSNCSSRRAGCCRATCLRPH
jgi:hypothetical protein